LLLLALETSSNAASVALFQHADLIDAVDLPAGQTTAQGLAPAIHQLLDQAGRTAKDVDVVAVAHGPGSFTGLRIGVVAAKTFAYAAGAQLVGVDTLTVIAAQNTTEGQPLHVVLDAQRKQLFAAEFLQAGELTVVRPTEIVDRSTWLEQRQAGDQVAGPALTKLAENLPPGVIATPSDQWRPTAQTVGQLGIRRATDNQFDDLWSFEPQYFRKSAAEEKAEGG